MKSWKGARVTVPEGQLVGCDTVGAAVEPGQRSDSHAHEKDRGTQEQALTAPQWSGLQWAVHGVARGHFMSIDHLHCVAMPVPEKICI